MPVNLIVLGSHGRVCMTACIVGNLKEKGESQHLYTLADRVYSKPWNLANDPHPIYGNEYVELPAVFSHMWRNKRPGNLYAPFPVPRNVRTPSLPTPSALDFAVHRCNISNIKQQFSIYRYSKLKYIRYSGSVLGSLLLLTNFQILGICVELYCDDGDDNDDVHQGIWVPNATNIHIIT